ncbi:hypothetical protein I553_5865 [Mycobacterium xenopi 4042]|uniref:Uncharacterized protein n=1 Tax=Mycobacterium xenopi 4042 TaxID=1299334 RepID=X7ZUY7_MYCXE|nr:hypothetical protein I553_5865 [Mycobacterium xenopi 4042]
MLAAPGQIVIVGAGARLSVVVEQPWRAAALAAMIDDAGLVPEITRTDEDTPLVRTAVDPGCGRSPPSGPAGGQDRTPQWLPARGSCGPGRWQPGAGRRPLPARARPHAPDTHSPLASALMRVGIAPTLIGTRGSRPALRISGRRRLSRLVENVGNRLPTRRRCRSGPAFSRQPRHRSRRVGLRRLAGVPHCQLSTGLTEGLWTEMERRHSWLTAAAAAAEMEARGDSSSWSRRPKRAN